MTQLASPPQTGQASPLSLDEIEGSVVTRFERVAREAPDRLAVQADDRSFTYADLDRAANRLAHAILRRLGPAEEPVVLAMEKSTAQVAAILAVLKAGKAYVVLNADEPRPRLATILADTGARLLLADAAHRALADDLSSPACPVLDATAAGEEDLSDKAPGVPTGPDTLLNLMYTSGSTGEPKGVLQNHRNVLQMVWSAAADSQIRGDDRVALVAPTSFGASAADLFGALLLGATLLPFDPKRAGLVRLAAWLEAERISVYHAVPTVFRNLMQILGPGQQLSHMRAVRLGGEAILRRDVLLFNEHFPPTSQLHLTLGTTETYRATAYVIPHGAEPTRMVLPLGYPAHGREILLLDEQGAPVPEDEVGEIAVRSRYVSPGYWRRPDLTAAAFLPDQDGGDTRTYRTGDLGRWLPDGALEHLGRKDFQVKVRGHRVSLAAVETALRELPGVREATVAARPGEDGGTRLVAYVVAANDPPPSADDLRAGLSTTLADYMLPAAYVYLDRLPLLSTGKVDVRALPEPGSARPTLGTAYVAPRTPLETALTGLWSEVLGVEPIGVDDDFWALGGNSLLAAQVLARLGSGHGVDLPLSALFEHATVADLAAAATDALAARVEEDELAALLDEVEAMAEDDA